MGAVRAREEGRSQYSAPSDHDGLMAKFKLKADRRHRNMVKKAKKFFEERKTRIGFLFNATNAAGSTKPEGSHWTAALFIKSKYKLFYFDSFGTKPPERIAKVLEVWRKAIMEALNKETEPELIVNKVQFQHDGTECGVWSIHFLDKGMNLSRLKENDFGAALDQLGIEPIYSREKKQQLRLNYFSTVDDVQAYNKEYKQEKKKDKKYTEKGSSEKDPVVVSDDDNDQ